jgi:uncharacterized protein YkwD/uncharacterized membrane protein required for colicin V production
VTVLQALREALTASLPSSGALTPLDYLCLITLGVFALDGLRRGLLLGALDLLALTATLAAAVSLYPTVGGLAGDYLDLPGAIANILAFALIFAIGQALYLVGASILRALMRPIFFAAPPLRLLDALGGLAPGFVKGAAIIALLAATFRALPMSGELKLLFDHSLVVGRTAPIATAIAPDLPALLGRLGLDSIVVAPPPQAPASPGSRQLQFPPNLRTEVEPATELQMLELVNRERAAAGLGALSMDDRLREAARAHSLEMFRLSYFAHESPIAGSPFDRMQRAGARFTSAGENLAYAPSVEAAHRGLMNSPEHRKNILGPAYRRVGIGVVRGAGWGRMFTQNFTD